MAKVIRLRLTGPAEEFWQRLCQETGLSDEQVFSKALWLLEKANARGKLDEKGVLHISLNQPSFFEP
jgi:hypothetical protein